MTSRWAGLGDRPRLTAPSSTTGPTEARTVLVVGAGLVASDLRSSNGGDFLYGVWQTG